VVFDKQQIHIASQHISLANEGDINTDTNICNQVNLAIYGNGVYHMTVRVFNALPNTLKDNSNDIIKFKDNLKKFLHISSFYTLDELFMR
jgi:hypothetical protein